MRRSLNHVVSFAAKLKAMYSASVDKNATVAYLFQYQLTRLRLSINMKPDVDFFMTWSLVQSKFEYLLIVRFLPSFLPLQVILTDFAAFKQRMIIFTVSICWRKEFLTNQPIIKIAKAMSDLVSTIENIRDFIIFQYCSCSARLASVLLSRR